MKESIDVSIVRKTELTGYIHNNKPGHLTIIKNKEWPEQVVIQEVIEIIINNSRRYIHVTPELLQDTDTCLYYIEQKINTDAVDFPNSERAKHNTPEIISAIKEQLKKHLKAWNR